MRRWEKNGKPPTTDDSGSRSSSKNGHGTGGSEDGAHEIATSDHIGQRVAQQWRKLGLKYPRRYDHALAAVKVSTLTADFSEEEILSAAPKIAKTPGLAWAGKRGPGYLAQQTSSGQVVLEAVLNWQDNDREKDEPVTTKHPPAWRPD